MLRIGWSHEWAVGLKKVELVISIVVGAMKNGGGKQGRQRIWGGANVAFETGLFEEGGAIYYRVSWGC